jgi:hypothetical protein
MRRQAVLLVTALLLSTGLAASVWAGPQVKKYQVTGPVVKVDEAKVTVQKGDELWEVAIEKDTKITGELKVGAKVTIEYQMYATSVTVKDAAAAEPAK